jgi:aspartate/glutamate racemase
MQITARALRSAFPEVKRVAVMGGVITYRERIYEEYLANNDMIYVHHDENVQGTIENIIEEIKLYGMSPHAVSETCATVSELTNSYRVDGIILGCTEFGCLQNLGLPVPVMDSSTELARHIVRCVTAKRIADEHPPL